jgi:hypothetical protein
MHKLSLLAILGLSLTACFEKDDTALEDTGDTTETGTEDSWIYVPTEIDQVTYGYDASGWSYSVDLFGWADLVTLSITQDTDPAWEEEHELENIDFAGDGSWDLWELDLAIVATPNDQVADSTTLFAGDAAMEATMLWRIDAYEGSEIADCVYWAGSSADVSIIADADCRELSF